ncbi:LPXTG cell wall anchor domain-containing protein [Micromonospora sp. RP3T]|uniref:LPXTG cell wall anchor domain-containing protein n=1 Tax=Micromonospora sp. RP3T TaxID=2135446 RepID=UPI000D16DA49|nr:LPXTG cell wall anchor domain-containing protein [Micromonospora sp. RP3T]PTA44590.1 cell wall anchor protein [Micromonospora sp. RP3T]
MRGKFPAGVLMALALLIPAAPAMARTPSPGPNEACQTVDRKVYQDVRTMVAIDLDTATTTQVRLLANQILAEANRESLPVLPGALQERLNGTADDLRAFLRTDLENAWSTALRVSVAQTLTNAGPNVRAAAKKVLDAPSVDAYLAYLNDGRYAARALDCASQSSPTPTSTPRPTPTPTPTPTAQPTPSATSSATTTGAPTAAPSASADAPGGSGGGLPLTGADTATVVTIGAVLLLLGGAGYLIGRRRRSRFVA